MIMMCGANALIILLDVNQTTPVMLSIRNSPLTVSMVKDRERESGNREDRRESCVQFNSSVKSNWLDKILFQCFQ